jgi:hypothetical protein
MKETMNDDKYDPRRNAHLKSAKSGKFKTERRGNFVPKNPLTALYLCHAYDVPYATFKRWKAEAFVTKNNICACQQRQLQKRYTRQKVGIVCL